MAKKDSNKQSLSKCFRKLFFHHYPPLIQKDLSKLLSCDVPSSCY